MQKKKTEVYSACIEKISTKDLKQIALLTNIYLIKEDGEPVLFRDHIWVDYHQNHFDKESVGKKILFVGKKYKYKSSDLKTKYGIAIKKTLSVFE